MDSITLEKLRITTSSDDRYDHIIHCIASEILHRVSIIKSSADLISIADNSVSNSLSVGTQLIDETCRDIQEIVNEIMVETLIPRLLKHRVD